METDEETHKKYLRNLSLSKDFDVEISDGNTTPLSVPFNTVYTSWGDMERISISSVKSIIKINIFDEKIKYQV